MIKLYSMLQIRRHILVVFYIMIFSKLALSAIEQNGIIPSNFKEGYLSAGFQTAYIDTNSNYDSNGNTYKLLPGYSLSMFQSLLYSRYDWSNQLSLYGELPMAYANSQNPNTKSTKYDVNGVALGGNYNLGIEFIQTILDFRGYLTIEKWNMNSNTIQTSDGANKFDIGVHFFKRFSQLRFHGYAGYEYRTNGFSGLLNYQGDASYLFGENVFTLGVEGYKTMTHDQYANSPSLRDGVLLNMNGQSFAIASADPSQTNLFGMLKLSASNAIDVYGSISKSLQGFNVANQITFTLGFEYFFEPIKHKKSAVQTIDINEKNNSEMQFEDEKTNPSYEKEIKDFNQPSQQKPQSRHRDETMDKNYKINEATNDLKYSRKDWVKKKQSPAQKSKRKKRVEITF